MTLRKNTPLRSGSHERRDDGMCAMEMVAWLAGEEHSDHPHCACPVLGAVTRAFNDSLLSDGQRERLLRRLVPKLVNSRATPDVHRRRAFRLVDMALRELIPAGLRATGDDAVAQHIERMPAVRNRQTAEAMWRELLRVLPRRSFRESLWLAYHAASLDPETTWITHVVKVASAVAAVVVKNDGDDGEVRGALSRELQDAVEGVVRIPRMARQGFAV